MANGTPGTPVEAETANSKRPKDTKFKQQRLPAWQPILTAGTVLPAFFAIGVAFIPLGVILLVTSNDIKEMSYDYTQCLNQNNLAQKCATFLSDLNNTGKICSCKENIELTEDFSGTVYMYYGLTNFYQNHRRYVRSRDDSQLHGSSVSTSSLLDDCKPYKSRNVNGSLESGYAPCGAIANSLFNDSFNLNFVGDGSGSTTVKLLDTGIAWVSDKNEKFGNPSSWNNFIRPPNWQKNVWDLSNDTNNNGYKNEDLIVWMRTAALPTFRKLHRRIDHTVVEFKDGLPKGKYEVYIDYAYPVTSFDGTKSIILTTTSWLGGKNPFLGIAYLVVGSICIVLGFIFLFIHIKWGRKAADMINITNSRNY